LNLIDTYNPDAITARNHGLERKLAMPKYLGTITQLSGERGILYLQEFFSLQEYTQQNPLSKF
jgi:hypothetical protein